MPFRVRENRKRGNTGNENRKRKRRRIRFVGSPPARAGKGSAAVKSRDMRTNFLASFLLLVASAAGQSTVELAGA